MTNKLKNIITRLLFLSIILLPQIVMAQGIGEIGGPLEEVRQKTGYRSEERGGDLGTMVGGAINTALTLVGLIFLVLMVYAGYLWMTARGEESHITKAKNILQGTIIGLVLVLSAYAITVFITSGIN